MARVSRVTIQASAAQSGLAVHAGSQASLRLPTMSESTRNSAAAGNLGRTQFSSAAGPAPSASSATAARGGTHPAAAGRQRDRSALHHHRSAPV
ncbi:hypothetical protein [Arthrobacter sp. B3I4]|uniref:hypothetical protein n=1 Tax=Arthrobacter sp. B3I4 TaxID=3042267 RepID=UPI00277F5628|nr:hypothetical protein [Arthrobacter sp. B3I4]MDQ0754537.1 hypothetical protein [Arthrobacter sp. B3I4]